MSNNIVTVVVSQQVAPAPLTLQRTGAFVSQGATKLTAGTSSLLTQFSDLTPLLAGSISITSMTLSAGVVTVTTSTPHGIPSGDTINGVIAGVVPAAYNGEFPVTYTGASTFTYPLSGSPASVTSQGMFTLEDVTELIAMATTFFAQGNSTSVYVLELGEGTPAQGVAALTTYLANPTLKFYSYLWPFEWSSESTAITLAGNNASLTSKVYFFVTGTMANYANWSANSKSVFFLIQEPTAPVTEFSAAGPFYVTLNYQPTNINKVTPTAFSFLVGVTPLILTGPQRTALKAAFVNWVDTGAEGGISNTILKWGTTKDGRDFTYWYSVDWMQINQAQALANAVINGSNNPQNPLYYNQQGINRLQAVAQGVVNSGTSFGLVNGIALVTAVPFGIYTTANPSDFPAGIYNGLALVFTPNRGFTSITFFLTVTDLPTS